jgi:hypothetical protein
MRHAALVAVLTVAALALVFLAFTYSGTGAGR